MAGKGSRWGKMSTSKVLIDTLVMAAVPLREGYGMTESTPMTIMTRYLEVVSLYFSFVLSCF